MKNVFLDVSLVIRTLSEYVCTCVFLCILYALCLSHSTITVCSGAFFVSININIPYYRQ